MTKKSQKEQSIPITVEGSLGLLAYGDIGLRAWREVKQKYKTEIEKNEEE